MANKEYCYIDDGNPGIIRFTGSDPFDGLLAGTRAKMICKAINKFNSKPKGKRNGNKK